MVTKVEIHLCISSFCLVVGLVVYMKYLKKSHIAEKGYELGTMKELSIINING